LLIANESIVDRILSAAYYFEVKTMSPMLFLHTKRCFFKQ
jgi:hypothetical protein